MTATLDQCPLHDLLDIPPRPAANLLVRRAGRFLRAIGETHLRTLAWQAGYTPADHGRGVQLFASASRQQTYGAWLDDEELEPHRDPDQPVLLEELERITDELRVRTAVAIARHIDRSLHDIAFSIVLDSPQGKTRYARARRRVVRIRCLHELPIVGAGAASAQLVRDGSMKKLGLAEWTLLALRGCIRGAPIDVERRADILADVMRNENELASWFADVELMFREIATQDQLDELGLRGAPSETAPLGAVRRFLRVGEA